MGSSFFENLVGALSFFGGGGPEDGERWPKEAAEENRKLKEQLAQLKVSHERAIDESTTLSRSLRWKQEDNAAAQQSLIREKDEKDKALSRNQLLAGELDDLKCQLKRKDNELENLRNELQHPQESRYEEASLHGGVEENQKPTERLPRLRASHRRAVDDPSTLSQSFKREQEDEAATQQSLRQERDEYDNTLSQNHRYLTDLDNLGRQLESKDAELKNLRNELQRSQKLRYEEKSLKGAEEEIRKLKGQLTQFTASHGKAVDESTALSQSLKRAQEDTGTMQQSLRQEREEKDRALSQSQRLMGELDNLRRRLESKDAELKNLRNELQHSQRLRSEKLLKGAEEEIRKLKGQLTQFTASHRKVVDDSTALSQSLKRTQEDMGTIQRSLLREREEKDRALSQSQRLMGELGGLRQHVESKDVELKNTQKELQHSQMERGELSALLEARSRELKGAQVYLTKADMLSGAEVIALVDALNVEILQTSAFISDSFGFARKSERAGEIQEASARISEFMGVTLAHLLGTVLHADDPLLVQIALQGATVEFSRYIIMAWDFDGLQVNQPLAMLYDGIRETETQAVSGRWRALTRVHAQKVALQGDLHAAIVAPVSDALVTILVAAGSTKSYEEIQQTFTQNFGERISNIIKMALRLNKALGEEVTSADLGPVKVTSGEKFDGATMANFESSGENLEGQTVLCTTALGLQRSEKVVQGDVVEFKVTTLLKPKVVLASVADGLNIDAA